LQRRPQAKVCGGGQGDEAHGVPAAVMDRLRAGADGKCPDTPTADHPAFANKGAIENVVVGSNTIAVDAARVAARGLGYTVTDLGNTLGGDARASRSGRSNSEWGNFIDSASRIRRTSRGTTRPHGRTTTRP